MKFLITGGAGFIGSHLVDRLVARGDDVVVLDDLSTGRRENLDDARSFIDDHPEAGDLDLVEGCATDAPLVETLMGEVDYCLHLASAVGVQLVVSQPLETLLRNMRGCDTVLAAAAAARVPLLYTSTSEIYGKSAGQALDEESDRIVGSPLKARWSYSTAKALGESLVHGYCVQAGADMSVVRLFNTTGPRQTGAYGMVVPRLVRQALAGEPLTVFGDGTQSRCFAHVFDVVEAILGLTEAEVSGQAYNIGAPEPMTVLELAERVLERTGSESRIELVPFEQAYGPGFEELGRRRPDTSAIRDAIGWEPRRNVDDAIDDVIEFERTGRVALAPLV